MTSAPPTFEEWTAPGFIPSAELVDTVAAALVARLAPDLGEWADVHPAVKGSWRQVAVDVLHGCGEQLVSSSLTHVIDHHTAFGFTPEQAGELDFARMVVAFGITEAEDVTYSAPDQSPDEDQPNLG